jgi:ribosomal protein L37AE/L43A
MKLLEEMYGGVGGLDNFDRAIEMINAAVEHHDRNDNFDAIADIEGLIQFLKGQYHDFTPQLEDTVRQIIADEMGAGSEEEEVPSPKNTWKRSKKEQQAWDRAHAKDPWLTNKLQSRGFENHYGAKAKGEEEESISDRIERMRRENKAVLADLDKRRQARKYGVHGSSSRRSRLGSRARGRLTSTEQEEVASMSDRRTRRDKFRPDVRMNRRGHRHADPGRRMAQLMARKARPHVSSEEQEWLERRQPWGDWEHDQEARLARLPDCPTCDGTGYHRGGLKSGSWNCPDCKGSGKQLPSRFPQDDLSSRGRDRLHRRGEEEEKKTNYDMQTTDWDKEVADFRERRKKHEPEAARSSRRSRRRMGGPSGNAFSLRFESFKGFLEKEDETPKSE